MTHYLVPSSSFFFSLLVFEFCTMNIKMFITKMNSFQGIVYNEKDKKKKKLYARKPEGRSV